VLWDGGSTTADLELDGDDAILGTIRFTKSGVRHFNATARLR